MADKFNREEFHERLLTDADFSMRRSFYEESKRVAEARKQSAERKEVDELPSSNGSG